MLPTRDTPQNKKNLYRLKVKGWKQIFQAKRQEKKAGVATRNKQHRLQIKDHKKRPKRSLHNT